LNFSKENVEDEFQESSLWQCSQTKAKS
jgi:hypothetical protein